ncbi:MAG TPA: hypothetical protein VG322_03545 [Candidatus Acidoferrales bacterium]|nr:hypothetical protein [Candidatus Acidoferrales bacterium]
MSREAEKRGLVAVKGVNDKDSLLELARSLGRPIAGADGHLIKELRVKHRAAALPCTLSAAFGTASFPLHTDTAFWKVPARFLVMRAIGDVRRPTMVYPFSELFVLTSERLFEACRRAVWTLKSSTGPVYCGMTFRASDESRGFRYDRQCMAPANSAAREVDEYMHFEAVGAAVRQVSWSDGTAVVIANWQALHGRGPEPPQEAERILQRIYVR